MRGQLPEGMYRISVRAADINDRMINTNTVVTGRVDGVTFEKGFPELLVRFEDPACKCSKFL